MFLLDITVVLSAVYKICLGSCVKVTFLVWTVEKELLTDSNICCSRSEYLEQVRLGPVGPSLCPESLS